MQSAAKIGRLGKGAGGRPGVSPDYYLDYVERGGEPGAWLGTGAAELGLDGVVERADMEALGRGRAPDGTVLARAGADRVPGWDFTFSAPKSVSLLYGLGDPDTRAAARAAHDRAVGSAISWLEGEGGFARRGPGGRDGHVPAGLVVAGFVHATSRERDPQLHTHAIVINVGHGADGAWSAIDSRTLYRHRMAAGAIYRAELRAELAELGALWRQPDAKGLSELAGLEPGLLAAFSRRRAQIVAKMAERGTTGALAAQAACLDSRATKVDVEFAELAQEWRARAAQAGLDPASLPGLLPDRGRHPRGPGRDAQAPDLGALAEHLLGPQGLTERAGAFRRDDVVRAVAGAWAQGATAAQVDAYTDAVLGDKRVVALEVADEDGEVLTKAHRGEGVARLVAARSQSPGRRGAADALCETRYSTTELLAAESALLRWARGSAHAGVGLVAPALAEAVLAAYRGPDSRGALSAEQEAAYAGLVGGGQGVVCVVGSAGAGKTYLLGAARQAWEAAGHPVVGLALAAEAAANLADGSGIASSTIDSLLTAARAGRGGLPRGAVVVLDEAGMADTRRLGALGAMARAAGAKLVLVGDPRQLPAVEAGGAFAGLCRVLGAHRLVDNARQIDPAERAALVHLRQGRVGQAAGWYLRQGRVTVAATPADLRGAVIQRWCSARSSGQMVAVLAYTREATHALNAAARAARVEAGELSGPEVAVGPSARLDLPPRAFAVGDEVICCRNVTLAGGARVTNGTRGAVVRASPGGALEVLSTRGARLRLEAGYVTDWVDHGYATTVHRAQGATVGAPARARKAGEVAPGGLVLVYDADSLGAEAAYVAASRASGATELFVLERPEVAPEDHGAPGRPDPAGQLARSWARSEGTEMAIDELARARAARELAATLPAGELARRRGELARAVARARVDPAGELSRAREALGTAAVVATEAAGDRLGAEAAGDARAAATAQASEEAAQAEALAALGALERAQRLAQAGSRAAEEGRGDLWEARQALALYDAALATQARWQARALALDPPAPVLELVGPPPAHAEARDAWAGAARAIEAHRRARPTPAPAGHGSAGPAGDGSAGPAGEGGSGEAVGDEAGQHSPWCRALGAEPFEASTAARASFEALAAAVAGARAAAGLGPLAEPGLARAVTEWPMGPTTASLSGPHSPALAAEALAHPQATLARNLLGPPPAVGPERVIWARAGAAALAAERDLGGAGTGVPPLRLALRALAEGADELAARAWDRDVAKLGAAPELARTAKRAEEAQEALAALGPLPPNPRGELADLPAEEGRLAANLAQARASAERAEEALAAFGPLGRRLHRDQVAQARDRLAGATRWEEMARDQAEALRTRRVELQAQAEASSAWTTRRDQLSSQLDQAREAAERARSARVTELGAIARAHPGIWLSEALGECPTDPGARAAWDQGAAAVLSYRAAYTITPEVPGLGPRPGPGQRERARAFDEAARAASWAHAQVRARSPEHQAEVARRRSMDRDHPYRSGPDLGPRREGPSLGM